MRIPIRSQRIHHNQRTQRFALETLEGRLMLATYAVPLTIPHDYSRDVTADLQTFINSVPDNSTIAFPTLTYDPATVGYKVEGTLTISGRHGLDFEGNGAFIRALDPLATGASNLRTRSQWSSTNSSTDLTWRNFTIYGANSQNPAAYASGAAYDSTREAQHAFDIVGGSSNILLENNTMQYTLGDGVYIGGSNATSFVTVQNNHIQYTGRQGMAPCQGHDILIQNNWIGDGARGLIDVEPGAASWSVDNLRIIGNTFGASRLLCLPMGGAGSIGMVYLANNTDVGANVTSWPKVYLNNGGTGAARRGPFVAVNNIWVPPTVNAPAFTMQPVDGMFIAGNDLNYDIRYKRIGVSLTNSLGAAIVNNVFENATAVVSADSLSTPVMEYNNPTTRAGWSRQTTVTPFATNLSAYSATAPDGAGGQVVAIWRVNSTTGALTYNGLSTTGDFAVVHVDSAGNFIEGWGFNNGASYNGQSLTLLRGAQTNQPPVVSTFAPTPSSVTLGQSATLTATASDPDSGDSISAIKFFEGSTLLGNGALSNGTWSFNWNTTGHATGAVTLTAIAYDSSNTPSAGKTADVTINAQPTQITETWTASNGSAWPVAWVVAGGSFTTRDIQSNTGHTYSSSGTTAAIYNTTAAYQDGVQQVSFKANSNGPRFGLLARLIASDNDSYYALETDALGTSNTSKKLYLKRVVDGVATTLATFTLGFKVNANAWYNLKFSVLQNGASTTLKGKLWATSSAEPSAWQFTATDSNARLQNRSGYGGLSESPSSNRHLYADNYTATPGAAAAALVVQGASVASPRIFSTAQPIAATVLTTTDPASQNLFASLAELASL